jgi:hypothetical protein
LHDAGWGVNGTQARVTASSDGLSSASEGCIGARLVVAQAGHEVVKNGDDGVTG